MVKKKESVISQETNRGRYAIYPYLLLQQIATCYFCNFPLRAASPPFRKPVRSRFLGSLHRRAKRPEGSEFVRFAMELDQWISKVKEGQHLEEHELQLLCEYVR